MGPGIVRQADQYGLDVPQPTSVPEQQVAHLLRSGPRIVPNTMNHRQAGAHQVDGHPGQQTVHDYYPDAPPHQFLRQWAWHNTYDKPDPYVGQHRMNGSDKEE